MVSFLHKISAKWNLQVSLWLLCFFVFQISIITVSASPVNSGFDPHSPISESYIYDEIESLAWVEVGLGRVLSKNEAGVNGEVLAIESRTAARGSTKLLNQFNSVESLIQGAGRFSPVKGAQQAFIKGDGASIFRAISQGGARQANGTVLMQDGTILFNHFSSKTGVYTIDINRAGQVFKIRVTP